MIIWETILYLLIFSKNYGKSKIHSNNIIKFRIKPPKREFFSYAVSKKKIYIFGGRLLNEKYNDLYEIEIDSI